MAEPTGPSLPQFDDKKSYLVKGKSLNAMIQQIKSQRIRPVQGGGIKILSQSDQGTFLASSGGILELSVCIGGNSVIKKFLIAE